MSHCDHYRQHDSSDWFYCESGSFVNNQIRTGFCDECPFHTERMNQPPPVRGAGDVVANTLAAVGVKKKKGCNCGSRQAWLNRMVPFGPNKQDKKWTVVVTAAPRQENTLATCVSTLRRAGWEPIIFAEPGTESPDDVEVKRNRERLGVWYNWMRSAEWALRTSAEYIMTVQDDTAFHPDSKVFTESILWPSSRVGFLSLYTPKHYSLIKNRPRPIGVNRIPTRSLWGACAMVWPRDVLRAVIDHKIARNWCGARPRSGSQSVIEKRRANPELIQNSDTAIGKIITSMKREMWFIDPSPVHHIAKRSTIGHGGNFGRRNCHRCADFDKPLSKQVPKPQQVVESQPADQSSMAITPELWQAIHEVVTSQAKTLEFGSGLSTSAFRHSKQHLAIEQNRDRAEATEQAVWSEIGADGWYQWQPDGQYDVILVDGPWKGFRSSGFDTILKATTPNGVIFVDDTHRSDERILAQKLATTLGRTITDFDRWVKIG